MNKLIFPNRNQFNQIAKEATEEVFNYYEKINLDFGSQGIFEKKYTDLFCTLTSDNSIGYADAVCSGTAAIYVAISALQLKKNSEVLVSPITDPGMINPIILNSLVPRLIDFEINSPYPNLKSIIDRYTPSVSAIILNHFGGIPIKEIKEICLWARAKNIRIIEDCSQAHFATINNQFVGTFGDIACFSTMFSKSHSTGGRGGIIYTTNKELYNLVRMYADKGKPFHLDSYNEKNPNTFQFPALNLNLDELSCAIGIKTLQKTATVIENRIKFIKALDQEFSLRKLKTSIYPIDDTASPFFWILNFESKNCKLTKIEFAEKLKEMGLPINSNYMYVAAEWPWLKSYISDDFQTKNAINFRDKTFNLLFNENFGSNEAILIAETIKKAEDLFYC